MHELFSDWYHEVQPTATRETIALRTAASSEILKSLTKAQVAELASFIVRPRAEAPVWFRGVFKEHDDLMPIRGVEEELRLLATVVLRIAFDPTAEDEEAETDDNDIPIASPLSLLVGAFGMKDEPKWMKEHLTVAADALSRIGRMIREPGARPSMAAPLTPQAVDSALAFVQEKLDLASEVNNYLWWAFTRHSRTLNERYDALTPPILAIVAPFDLFHFVRTLPIAPETETLLLHVLFEIPGAREAKLSFKNFVSALGHENALKLHRAVPAECQSLCPIHWTITAIAESRTWQHAFDSTFGFRSATLFTAAAIAIQYLRELSLTKIFAPRAGK